MPVALQQRHVPFQHARETLVAEGAHRNVAAEEHSQIEIGLRGDPAQERRLILDRMGDEIGQPDRRIEARLHD